MLYIQVFKLCHIAAKANLLRRCETSVGFYFREIKFSTTNISKVIVGLFGKAHVARKPVPHGHFVFCPWLHRNAHCPQIHPAVRPPKNKDYWTSVCPRTRPLTESLAPTGSAAPPAMRAPVHRSNWSLTNPTITSRRVRVTCICRTTFPRPTRPPPHPTPSCPTPTRPFALANTFPMASTKRKSPKSTKRRSESA